MKKNRYVVPPHYDESDGISEVVINTPYGICSGTAFLDPNDADIASEYFGCYLAEYRALTKALKLKSNSLHNKYLGALSCQKAYNAIHGDQECPAEINQLVENYRRQWKKCRNSYHSRLANEKNLIKNMIDFKTKLKDYESPEED